MALRANRERTGRFWPSPVQEQLLVAALGDPAEAAAAWRGLPDSFSLDELEPGSFELLPLVYRNLSGGGYEDDRLPRLKGIYRRAWVKNNLLAERTREIGEALRTAEIRSLFLEGPAVALRYYPDLGLRPTSTVHVLVARTDEGAAARRLQRTGWSERAGSGAYPDWRFLFDGGGNICVLRASIAFDVAGTASLETRLWQAAEPQEVAGIDVLVPAPTDALLAICLAGARAGPLPRTQWIADAAMVLRGDEIDWDRLLELGLGSGQALRLRQAFGYLRGLPGPHAPEAVQERLEQVPATRRERLIYELSSGSIRGLAGLSETLADHLAASGDESLMRSLATFPGRVRDRWGLEHNWQLPLAAGRRAVRIAMRRKTA